MNTLNQMLSDGEQASSTRGMMLATGAIILVRYLAMNVAAIVAGKGGFDFSATDVALLGVVLGGKVAQSFFEGKK